MLYLTCTTITSVDLAHYGVSRAKDWVSVYCGTKYFRGPVLYMELVLNGCLVCRVASLYLIFVNLTKYCKTHIWRLLNFGDICG